MKFSNQILCIFKNLPTERFWVGVNARVNHPIKHVLAQFDNVQVFDM